MKNRYILYALLMLVLSACSESEDTTPSYADTDRLETLLDKDIEQIVKFRDDYGTYLLYNFDQNLDFAYQFEQASNWTGAAITKINHDEAVGAVAMLYGNVFNAYNDAFKKKYFPRKMLMAADVKSTAELGYSVARDAHHTAMANINSVTFAKLSASDVAEAIADDAVMTVRCNEMHRALLADYLVKSRAEYPVGDEYFTYSQTYYSALMNSNRKNAAQLVAEDPDFFYNHGFFFPDEDESTYFPSAEDDVIAYIRNMITMDKETADRIMELPVMADKMHIVAVGLQEMGVDVMKINPWTEQFLKMEYVQPAVMYVKDAVTDNPKATLEVTILRGSHALDHIDVSVNGKDAQSIDLTSYDRMRIVLKVDIDGLVKGANAVRLSLFEQEREKPAVVLNTGVSYASMAKVSGINIRRIGEEDDVYRTVKISKGEGWPVDKEQNPNLTTIALEKHGWLDRYYNEYDSDYRAWKVYQQDGHVTKIMEYVRGFNEDMTNVIYALTETYEFEYNEFGELQQVTLAKEDGEKQTIVSDVAYVNGRMMRYSYMNKPYEPVYATVNGVTTRVDCLDTEMLGKRFGFTGNEDLNPYYMPELPAVIPGFVAEIPLQLFYSQYVFESIEGVWNGGWTTVSENGAFARRATVTINGQEWQFTFALEQ